MSCCTIKYHNKSSSSGSAGGCGRVSGSSGNSGGSDGGGSGGDDGSGGDGVADWWRQTRDHLVDHRSVSSQLTTVNQSINQSLSLINRTENCKLVSKCSLRQPIGQRLCCCRASFVEQFAEKSAADL